MDFKALSFSNAPLIKTPPPGPKSKEYLDYQSGHESSAVYYPKGLPMALRRAKGATVEDVDGNIYIDFWAGSGVMSVGHANPEVIDAIKAQLDDLTHALDFPHPSRKALVEALLQVLPKGLTRVLFGGPTGSDANELAVKLAKFNTGRHPMIAFQGSYHGMGAGALSLSSSLGLKEDFLPLVPDVHFIPYAYCYRCAFGREPASCDLECANYLDYILDDPYSGVGKPAAVILEPIQGAGGMIVPPEGFLPRIREICDKHEVLMIDDEIMAGFCRTGRMFACEHTDTLPDIITMSKAIGGVGIPLSGIAYKEKLDTLPKGKHAGTYRSNVLACASGAAAIRFMVHNELTEHVAELGGMMLSTLKEIEEDSQILGEARGKGFMMAMELVQDKATKKPAPELAVQMRSLCHRRGLLSEVGGHYANCVRFLPPLVLTEDLAKKGLEIFADSLVDIEKSL
jgi:diaminobutyrate-2-oxoglutarate transaminase